MNRIAGLLAVTSLLLVAGPGFGAGKPSTNGYKATVADVGLDAVPFRLMSDGSGTYAFSFTGPGDLSLDSGLGKKRPTRAHVLDFSEEITVDIDGQPLPNPLSGVLETQALLIVGCGTQRGIDMQAIATGSSVLCPVWFAFDWAGAAYRIGFNSASGHVPDPPGDYMQGEDARVTCTAGATTGSTNCSAWRIEAAGAATPVWYGEGANATLDSNPKSRGILFDRNTNEILGYYYFSFLIDAVE